MLKTDPLSWSTLDEAADWLAARTETPWTPRRVLDAVTRIVAVGDHLQGNPYTPLFVAPPAITEFILQPMPGVHPPGAEPEPRALPWQMLPLRLGEARQLFASGAVVLRAADPPWNQENAQGVPMFGMELRPPVMVALADARLPAAALRALLSSATTGEQTATAGPLTAPTETPEQRRERLLNWHNEETQENGKTGAVERVTTREKILRPTADRSNIGKDIKKAREERAASVRAGALFRGLVG